MKFKLMFGVATFASALLATTARGDEKSDYCEQVDQLMGKLDAIEQLKPDTSMGTARDHFRAIQKEAMDVRQAGRALEARSEDRIKRAQEDLMSALKRIPDEATVEQGRHMIQPQLQALRHARQQSVADLSCAEK